MKKILLLSLLFVTFQLSAAPIGEKRAREMAVQFFVQNLGVNAEDVKVELEWAGSDVDKDMAAPAKQATDDALIYIFNRTDTKGFVILAGDDKSRPVLAFAFDNTFDVENIPDGARWMLSCWCRQVEAKRNELTPYQRLFR